MQGGRPGLGPRWLRGPRLVPHGLLQQKPPVPGPQPHRGQPQDRGQTLLPESAQRCQGGDPVAPVGPPAPRTQLLGSGVGTPAGQAKQGRPSRATVAPPSLPPLGAAAGVGERALWEGSWPLTPSLEAGAREPTCPARGPSSGGRGLLVAGAVRGIRHWARCVRPPPQLFYDPDECGLMKMALLYFSDFWNKLDICAILLFMAGLICR